MKSWQDKKDFKDAVFAWATKLGIKVESIYLRPMKKKWASCSTSGHLNFNNDLVEIDKILGEYVIVHELLHFRTPNHGPLWKNYMNAYLPDWEKLDKRLKTVTENGLKDKKE
jgi:predicted metal-dependent hydrolase